MALHAAQNVGSAITITREFLTPFDIRYWLKLTLVVFFIGGGLHFPSVQFDMSGSAEQIPESDLPITVSSDIATLITVLVVVPAWHSGRVPRRPRLWGGVRLYDRVRRPAYDPE